jgi:hypothetical protein
MKAQTEKRSERFFINIFSKKIKKNITELYQLEI